MKSRSWLLLRPTGLSFALVFILATMWYGAASQGNPANYLLLFFTVSVFLISIPHTAANLSGLKVTPEAIKPAFAGQEAVAPLEIVNHSRRLRYRCVFTLPGKNSAAEIVDVLEPGCGARVSLRFPVPTRGEYTLGQICLTSSYPLGFLRAQHTISAAQLYCVYPELAGDATLPGDQAGARASGRQTLRGEGDDFAGVRPFVPGESQRHIDWKAVARGAPLMTKQFTVEADDALVLDFAALPMAETETRLSQLALWIVEAERAHRPYALRLPGLDVPAASGDAHYHRCLQALAVYR